MGSREILRNAPPQKKKKKKKKKNINWEIREWKQMIQNKKECGNINEILMRKTHD